MSYNELDLVNHGMCYSLVMLLYIITSSLSHELEVNRQSLPRTCALAHSLSR